MIASTLRHHMDSNSLYLEELLLLLQALQAAFLWLHDWIPLGRLNDIAAMRGHRVLALIVLGAAGLSLRWVFLVPIFQAPDEYGHLDYGLCLYEHGLFRAKDIPAAAPVNYVVHPLTEYLCSRSRVPRKNGDVVGRGLSPTGSPTCPA